MTIDQIRPSRKPDAYRNRATGQRATVVAYRPLLGIVELLTTAGRVFLTDVNDFWAAYIHRDLYQTDRNDPQPPETP